MLNIRNNEIYKIREIVVMGRQKSPRFSPRERGSLLYADLVVMALVFQFILPHEKSDKKRSHKLPRRKPPRTTGVGKVP